MKKDGFTRKWIIENSVEILQRYEAGVLTLRGLYYVEATGKSVIETEFIYLAKENLLQKDLSDSIDPTDCTDHKKVVFKPNACNQAENFGRNLARRLQAEGKAQEER